MLRLWYPNDSNPGGDSGIDFISLKINDFLVVASVLRWKVVDVLYRKDPSPKKNLFVLDLSGQSFQVFSLLGKKVIEK